MTRDNDYVAERSIVMSVSVCLSVCPQAYLRNYTSDLHQFLRMIPMPVARASSVAALRYAMYFRFYSWRHIY